MKVKVGAVFIIWKVRRFLSKGRLCYSGIHEKSGMMTIICAERFGNDKSRILLVSVSATSIGRNTGS